MQDQKASKEGSENSGQVIRSSQVSQQSYPQNLSIKSQEIPKVEEVMANEQQERSEGEQAPLAQSTNSPANTTEMQAEVKYEKEEDITMGMQVVDLNRYLFNGLVYLCRKEKLLEEEVTHTFLINHAVSVDKQFIQFFREGKLREFDFQKCKISLFDHRKLTKMLVEHNPEKYLPLSKPQNPYDFVRESQQFLKQIYQMSETEYQREWEEQVLKHSLSWWGGPERIDPICDPPIKFYETQQGQKTRIEREQTIQVETVEEEKERNKRIGHQRTNADDLKNIAKVMGMKLYGSRVKLEDPSQSRSSQGIAGESFQPGTRSKQKKEKKIKKEKKEKKDKKDKKKHKKDKSSKHSKEVEPKKEPDSDQGAGPKKSRRK